MTGAPHQICASRVTQRNRPSLPKAMRPPWRCASVESGTRGGSSVGSQPPVMKQTSPVPMQSPAAIPELPLTLSSMWFHMSNGADHKGDPSEPRTARNTPWTSSISEPCSPVARSGNVLNTTAGSASFGCSRITTGVLITWM